MNILKPQNNHIEKLKNEIIIKIAEDAKQEQILNTLRKKQVLESGFSEWLRSIIILSLVDGQRRELSQCLQS